MLIKINESFHAWYALIFSVMMLLIGYVDDAAPHLMQIHQLRDEEKNIKNELSFLRKKMIASNKKIAMVSTHHVIKDRLSALLTLAQSNGLVVQSVKSISSQQNRSNKTNMMQLQLLGQFQSGMSFILALSNEMSGWVIENFSVKANESSQEFILVVMMVDESYLYAQSKLKQNIFLLSNPFCTSNNWVSSSISESAMSQSVSLHSFKMIGVLRQGERRKAFFMLPTGETFLVGLGTVLGKERGMVTAIHANAVEIRLPDKKSVNITLSKKSYL